MGFIIKNVRNHAIVVGGVTLAPGEQHPYNNKNAAIEAALDAGDLSLTDEGPPEHIDLQPFHSGDKAIDG